MPEDSTTGQIDFEWIGERMCDRPRAPAGQRGAVQLTIETVPAGQRMTVVTMRNAIFAGQPPAEIAFDWEVEIRRLTYPGGEWMADTPQEIWQMHAFLERLADDPGLDVLIGGLGLGVLTKLTSDYGLAVVTTVERDLDVIALTGDHAGGQIEHADVTEYLRRIEPGQFAVACLDTWQSTGLTCWQDEVVPLRRLAADKIPEVFCWAEDEMIGQVRMQAIWALATPAHQMPPSAVLWRTLSAAARQAGLPAPEPLPKDDVDRLWALQQRGDELNRDPAFARLLDEFTTEVGSETWEARFGELWDRHAAERIDSRSV